MIDLHNTKSEVLVTLDKAGFVNIKHPITVQISNEEVVQTIGTFDLCVGVKPETKGVNMSRFISVLNKSKITQWSSKALYNVMKDIEKEVQGEGVHFSMNFDFMMKKVAPVSKQEAYMPYSAKLIASLGYENNAEKFDFQYGVTVVGKCLCPCSKAISDYSAHNQRSYVSLLTRVNEDISFKELVEIIEKHVSCPIYPIVKRVDEKYMTEKAYDNPKFTEDTARGLANQLLHDNRVTYFSLKVRAEDSILPYDAYAELEKWK